MRSIAALLIVGAAATLLEAQAPTPKPPGIHAPRPLATAPAGAAAGRRNISYADALPILQTLREDLIPQALRARTPGERERLWPQWVSQRDAEIRARLERGDEDSIVNFLFFGVSFTRLPRVKLADLLGRVPAGLDLLQQRIAAMTAAMASPGANERLAFVGRVVQRKGLDLSTDAGNERVRSYLLELANRVLADIMRYDPTLQTAAVRDMNLFSDRGLASDTSISPDYSIDRALAAMKAGAVLGGRVSRVAILGPGLDFTDKYEGYDFYPQQTIQPFAVIDSLMRLGLMRANDFRMTTFDLSPRINQHIDAARQRARHGEPYLLQLPRDGAHAWSPGLVDYWKSFGDHVGDQTPVAPAPSPVEGVDVRAVRVPPAVVLSIMPRDLDIVLQRMAPLAAGERFDLIVGTNILVYYDVFEQALALANVAAMLRPGGVFLCNSALVVLPATPLSVVGHTDVVFIAELRSGDRVTWYQRR